MFRVTFLQLQVQKNRSHLVIRSTPSCHNQFDPAACCHKLPVRTSCGVRTMLGVTTMLGIRTASAFGTASRIRTISAVKTMLGVKTALGIRTMSGIVPGGGSDGTAGTAGWYSSLADSGPVHLCEQYLVGVQQVSGFPWWMSIITATVAVRTLITLPLAAYQMVIIAKVEALQAEISELAKRLRYEVSVRARERGWTEKQKRFQFQKNLRRLVSHLYIRDNCHPFKASVLVWVQLPLWLSLSLAIRNLSLDHSVVQTDLASGGTLWFLDLTSPDSTWILPICLGLTNLFIIEVFSLQRLSPSPLERFITNSMRVLSVLMVPVAASVPSSMALYWFFSSLLGFCHNLVLRSPAIHKLLKLSTQRSNTPYKDLLAALINKYCK